MGRRNGAHRGLHLCKVNHAQGRFKKLYLISFPSINHCLPKAMPRPLESKPRPQRLAGTPKGSMAGSLADAIA